MRRKGPKIRVEYSCHGCEWLVWIDGVCHCREPDLVEKHGCSQHLGQPDAPDYMCRYREDYREPGKPGRSWT